MMITPSPVTAPIHSLTAEGGLAAPTLSPDLQLLITCARLELTSLQQEQVRGLCRQIADWSATMHLADRHLVLPLVYRHLRSLEPETISKSALSAMRQLHQNRLIHIMGMVAEQQRLVQQVFHPLGASYALVKGSSLALRYYGNLGLRQWRDIDVLIAPDRMFEIAQAMVDRGYRTYPEALGGRALKFACQHPAGETKLISPQGTVIELHPWLDRKGCIFPTQKVLALAEPLKMNGKVCQVLPTCLLFVYICYHHSRHQWSKLHWLADLDAFQRHPSFDLAATQTVAAELGLGSTVQAALALHQACGQPNPQAVVLHNQRDRTMRDACLHSLATGQELQTSLRPAVDFSFTWQVKLRYLFALTIAYLRPTYSDYKAWPLPSVLYPLYYLIRPMRAAGIVITRRVQGAFSRASPRS